MGGGIAGWLTPGWMIRNETLAPHIAEPGYIKTMLAEGEDPKPLVHDECKPQCILWKGTKNKIEMK